MITRSCKFGPPILSHNLATFNCTSFDSTLLARTSESIFTRRVRLGLPIFRIEIGRVPSLTKWTAVGGPERPERHSPAARASLHSWYMSAFISGLSSAMVSPTVTNRSMAKFTPWPTLAIALAVRSVQNGRSLCATNVDICNRRNKGCFPINHRPCKLVSIILQPRGRNNCFRTEPRPRTFVIGKKFTTANGGRRPADQFITPR